MGNVLPTKRVLVVDDDPDTVEVLGLFMRILGYETRAAATGQQALEADAQFEPHVVLLDISLPDISGYEVARALRKRGRRSFLAAATGWGRAVDQSRSAEAGFDLHVTKPFDGATIRRLMRLATQAG